MDDVVFVRVERYLYLDTLTKLQRSIYVAKGNLGKVNLKPMHPAVSRICGVAAGACLT